jgi:hypothetical protein
MPCRILQFECLDAGFQAVELLLPEAAVEDDPAGSLPQRFRHQRAAPDTPGLVVLDESGPGQDAQVLGDRRK